MCNTIAWLRTANVFQFALCWNKRGLSLCLWPSAAFFWPNFHALDGLSAFGISFSASCVPHSNFRVSGLRKPWTDWRVTKSLGLFLEVPKAERPSSSQTFLGPRTVSPHGTTNSNQLLHDDQTETNIFLSVLAKTFWHACWCTERRTRVAKFHWRIKYAPIIWPRATKFCTVIHVGEGCISTG